MAKYSDLELRYARPVARALLDKRGFRSWFLSKTKYESPSLNPQPVGEEQGRSRSPNLKNPYWFNYWCGKDSKCECRVGSGIETDVFLIFDCSNQRRLGLHIEVKRPGDKLREGQAESYPRRAACWANPDTKPKTVLRHDDHLTILICGRDLAADERIQNFDKVVFHDDIAQKLEVYPDE